MYKFKNPKSCGKEIVVITAGAQKKTKKHFSAKPKRSHYQDMFVYYVFILIFKYVMIILKEFCISKESHSKNLVNQPTLIYSKVRDTLFLLPLS